MTKPQAPPLPTCQRCSAQVETDTDLCVQCLCEDLGITYRQLDYWSRMGYLRPVRVERGKGRGAGSPRAWPPEELQVARLMGRLTAAGMGPSLAAACARKWPDAQEIAPGVFLQIKQEAAEQAGPEPGTVTEWGVRWTYFGETVTETWSEEGNARACLEETLASGTADAGTPVTLLRREIGPWKEAPDG